MRVLNATHDPQRRSWVESANVTDNDFPIQNLPHGVFKHGTAAARGGVAIGDRVVDMAAALKLDLFSKDLVGAAEAAAEPTLNRLMSLGPDAASKLRARLSDILRSDGPERAKIETKQDQFLIPLADIVMELPVKIGAFTDFCTSVPHVSVERTGRPAIELNPAFKHLPIAYNSRASSVVPNQTTFPRPLGQGRDDKTSEVYFGPSRRMDFELEFGMFVGASNPLGEPVHIDRAPDKIWGYAIVNDWSARDIQTWETMLGPFLGKSFRTTISPWIVTQEAMSPFKTKMPQRGAGDPKPFPYLTSARHEAEAGLNIRLQAFIRSAQMRAAGMAPHGVADTNTSHLYWSMEQMLTHHTSNGCNLQVGDLLASGTVSGPAQPESACMWEITGGIVPVTLPTGEKRYWIEDGDEVIFTGKAQAQGYRSIGFGACSGEIRPAQDWPNHK